VAGILGEGGTLSDGREKRDIGADYTEKSDHLPGMTREQKNRDRWSGNQAMRIFDQPLGRLIPGKALPFFRHLRHDIFGVV